MNRWLYWLPACGWAGVIFYLSTRPGSAPPSWWFPNADKVIHAILYGILASCLLLGFRRGAGMTIGRAALAAFAATVLYGASDEVHQLFTPGRSSDLLDVAADAVGGLIAFPLSRIFRP